MLPLTTADLLAMTIVGSVLENMDMERLIAGQLPFLPRLNQLTSRDWIRGSSADQVERRVDGERRGSRTVSPALKSWRRARLTFRELHERLMLRNEQTKQIHLPEVYNESEDAKKNVLTWMNSQLISEAVTQIINVS